VFEPDNNAYTCTENFQAVYTTYIIIAATVLVSFYAFNRPDVMSKLVMSPYQIKTHNQYYRLVSSGFIHADHMHLLVNMFSLFFFGPAVESELRGLFGESGVVYFLSLYFLGMIASDLPSYLKNRNRTNYNSLGASGAIAAVVFAYIIFKPLQHLCIFIGICMPGFILGTLYIVFSYLQGRKPHAKLQNINHDAHLYGALFGLVFCIIVYPRSLPDFVDQIKNWDVFN
jgi:membrane associated rhomboid family serine protease